MPDLRAAVNGRSEKESVSMTKEWQQFTMTKCRQCDFAGEVGISKKDKNFPAVTGVPCPVCGKHSLRKLKQKGKGR